MKSLLPNKGKKVNKALSDKLLQVGQGWVKVRGVHVHLYCKGDSGGGLAKWDYECLFGASQVQKSVRL